MTVGFAAGSGHDRRPPRPTRTSSSSASTSGLCIDETGDIADPATFGTARVDAGVARSCRTTGHRVEGAAARLPRRHRGRLDQQDRPHRRRRRHGVRPRRAQLHRRLRNGAKSVNPDVSVTIQYVSAAPDAKAFADPAGGKAFAQQLLAQRPGHRRHVPGRRPDRQRRPAGRLRRQASAASASTSTSSSPRPETAKCTVVSAEKKLKKNVSDAIVKDQPPGRTRPAPCKLDITTDDVGLSPFHDSESLITPDTQAEDRQGRRRP